MTKPNCNENPLIVEYDPKWIEEFDQIAIVLKETFGSFMSRVCHVGSTSIPGMAAKPVLDIIVELAPGVTIAAATEILVPSGYDYEGDLGIPGRYAYRNTSPAVPFSKRRSSWMHHHLYICPHSSAEFARMMLFRDKLRNSMELRQEYLEIKQQALQRAKGIRQIYVDEKARLGDSFFKRVLNS